MAELFCDDSDDLTLRHEHLQLVDASSPMDSVHGSLALQGCSQSQSLHTGRCEKSATFATRSASRC